MFPAVLDASLFTLGSTTERLQFAQDLVKAFNEDGFVKLQNHGIPSSVIKDLFAWHKRFFDLPKQTKETCAHQGGPVPVRGYNSYGQERSWKCTPGGDELVDPKDARESLDIGPPWESSYPTPWLADDVLPSFRQHIESYYTAFHNTGNYLLEALELGLALPSGSITSRARPDSSELRLNHYPSLPKRELTQTNTRRIWPHTDLGLISLNIQDNEGGLEYEDRQRAPGRFVPVCNENSEDLIVSGADILERWTNGVLKGALHRVMVPGRFHDRADKRVNGMACMNDEDDDVLLPVRNSVVFLYRPGEEKSAGPMTEFVSADRPAMFEEITAGGYLEGKNSHIYA